jgi:hypothetical protein
MRSGATTPAPTSDHVIGCPCHFPLPALTATALSRADADRRDEDRRRATDVAVAVAVAVAQLRGDGASGSARSVVSRLAANGVPFECGHLARPGQLPGAAVERYRTATYNGFRQAAFRMRGRRVARRSAAFIDELLDERNRARVSADYIRRDLGTVEACGDDSSSPPNWAA